VNKSILVTIIRLIPLPFFYTQRFAIDPSPLSSGYVFKQTYVPFRVFNTRSVFHGFVDKFPLPQCLKDKKMILVQSTGFICFLPGHSMTSAIFKGVARASFLCILVHEKERENVRWIERMT